VSGVELLPLGEVVKPSRPRVKPTDYPYQPFIGMEHVEAHSMKLLGTVPAATMKSSAVHFKPGDVLYGRLRPYLNKVYRPSFEGLCSAEFIVLPENERVDGGYLQYFLNSSVFVRYASHLNTGDRPRVDFDQLAPFEIPLPDLDEQRRIVAEIEKQFSRLDEAVANLKRVKANLKRQAAAVLSAAVSGLLSGRAQPRSSADRPEMAPLVELPAGWSWAAAADACEIVASGSTPKPDEMTAGSGEIPFIKVYNLGFDGSLDFTIKPTFIRRAIHEGQLARSRCVPGDVLMNIVGPPLGKVSVVPDEYPEWNINQAVVTFRVGPRMLNRLLAYWLMSPPVQRRIEKTSKATAGQFNVQVSTCRKLVLPLPPLEEQHRIVAELDRRLSIVREVEAEVDANLKRAQALRQAVLARAFAAPRASRAATVAV
jgi:type I restriction enzyme S subunit